ncbi:MAG TPA: glycine cleavage T C-terminal barrel domain-containing protein [Longimicrobiales bacterium]|nr:glycine cleavage T C-terminal barrel domain-containing protein [Longimicrobiales bacterium]
MSMTTDTSERRGELYGSDVVRSYGDAANEYAALRADAGVVVREDRVVLRVHGRDPVKMVHGLVTNDLVSLAPGQATYAVLLTPKGRMLGEMRVLRREDDLLLDVDAAALDGVLTHLKKFVPPLFARFEPAEYAVLGVYGSRAYDVLRSVCDAPASALAEDQAATGTFAGDVVHVIGSGWSGGAGADVFVSAAHADALRDALMAAGARACGHAALDVLRIEAGVPRWGAELDETTIPLEADLGKRAISTTKGCYTGQEVIIRILHRGHVNWHLRGLLLGDAPVPARGTTLARPGEDRAVARITSACVSPRFDQTIALGYVRREIEPPAELVLADTNAQAQVVLLPFTE